MNGGSTIINVTPLSAGLNWLVIGDQAAEQTQTFV